MARWVTIRPDAFPIDYRAPSGAWLHFKKDTSVLEDSGERFLPDDQADFMVNRGYATEGKLQGSTARSRKGKTTPRKTATKAANAKAADRRRNPRLGAARVPAADSAGHGDDVDQAAG